MNRPETKPPKVYSKGHHTVTVYHTPKFLRGKWRGYCEVRWEDHGVRNRVSKSSWSAATSFAKAKLKELVTGKLGVSQAEYSEYGAWKEELQELGVSFQELVDCYRRNHVQVIVTPLGTVIAEFLLAQKEKGVAETTWGSYKSVLNIFLEKLRATWPYSRDKGFDSVSVREVDGYLQGIPTASTRRAHRRVLVTLWKWARRKGYCPPGDTVAEKTETPLVVKSDPVPFRYRQLCELMEILDQGEQGFEIDSAFLQLPVALAALGGMRTAEISRLRWEHFDFEEGEIWLPSEVTKTNRRRKVALPKEWMKIFRKAQALIINPGVSASWQTKVAKLLEEHGVPWVDNGLRKGFISHAVNVMPVDAVAAQTGHLVSTLETEYKGLVPTSESRAWMEIPPGHRLVSLL